jgi:PDZ domain
MSMRRFAGILSVLTAALAAHGCREGPERAEATPPAAPEDRDAEPATPLGSEGAPSQPRAIAPGSAGSAGGAGGAGGGPTPRLDEARPRAPARPRFDLVDPWAMSLVEVQGRGVMIERLGMQSFATPLLQPGDVIIAVDNRAVMTSAEIERYLRSIPPGAMVVVTVRRDDDLHYVMLQVPPA